MNCTSQYCRCSYVPYTSMLKYLAELELDPEGSKDTQSAIRTEARLKEQLVEASRLFDSLVGRPPGYFTHSHAETLQLVLRESSTELYFPLMGREAVELTLDGYIVPSTYYRVIGERVYIDGADLTLTPERSGSGCSYDWCSSGNSQRWRPGIYELTVQATHSCPDPAVEGAIRDYVMGYYRVKTSNASLPLGQPRQSLANIPPPYSWLALIERLREQNYARGRFGIG